MHKFKLFLKVFVCIYMIISATESKEVEDTRVNIEQSKDSLSTNNVNKPIINSEKTNVSNSTLNVVEKTLTEVTPPSNSVKRILDSSSVRPLSTNIPAAAAIAPEIKTNININSNNKNKNSNFDDLPDIDLNIDIDNVDNEEKDINATLALHNITKIEVDYHEYYNSTIISNQGKMLYRKSIYAECANLTISDLLSRSHRRAMTVKLPFEFPFYGYPIKNITIATGGFLYAGDYIHSWLAATQYIAPLMANFDTSISNDSFVKHCETDKAFHVFWEKVHLQNRSDMGPFTFSASLYNNGDIVFNYYSLPVEVEKIEDAKHPVKVGISDAYIIDNTVYHARRKTIYEYHRVNFEGQDILNNTQIKLSAISTCISYTSCEKCLKAKFENMNCNWCPSLQRCSSGMDRKRQEWLSHGCNKSQVQDIKGCAVLQYSTTTPNSITSESPFPTEKEQNQYSVSAKSVKKMNVPDHEQNFGLITSLCVVFGFVFVIAIWLVYSYLNPLSKSGQLLIKYRPWAWHRRGEARYTAASIHM